MAAEEAKAAKKTRTCAMCGRPIKGAAMVEKINDREYCFDKQECALFFKKFKSVYGSNFCVAVNDGC